MKPNIELVIEELVLHGFPPGDRYRIARTVEGELARLLGEGKIPPALARGGEMARLDGGGFEVAPGAKPEVIGAQVARAVYGGMGK